MLNYLRSLPPKRRAQFGLFLLGWGAIGSYLIEPVEKTLHMDDAPKKTEELVERYAPHVRVVEKGEKK